MTMQAIMGTGVLHEHLFPCQPGNVARRFDADTGVGLDGRVSGVETSAARLARSFAVAAEEYERGRPAWPEAALDLVPVPASATVLDLAAGTGKLTRVLAARYRRVVAVEPLDELRAVLARTVPGAETLAGRAEAIPLPDASADAVFAADAFHWFATAEAVAELARVLRPGGTLALLWNVPDPDEPSPLPPAYRARFAELREAVPLPQADWRAVLARGGFGEVRSGHVDHVQVSTRERVLAFAASTSLLASRPKAERRALLQELGALLPEGEYRFPLRAEVHRAAAPR
jgi:SAM-dependent methyltransferase